MPYDLNALKDKIVAQLLLIQTDNQPKLTSAVTGFIANAEERYKALLEYMADGGETKFLLDRLKEEKDIFEQEVLCFFVIAKGAVQSALNNVQDILLQEVRTVLTEAESKLDELEDDFNDKTD